MDQLDELVRVEGWVLQLIREVGDEVRAKREKLEAERKPNPKQEEIKGMSCAKAKAK